MNINCIMVWWVYSFIQKDEENNMKKVEFGQFWQVAKNSAQWLLLFSSSRRYGLWQSPSIESDLGVVSSAQLTWLDPKMTRNRLEVDLLDSKNDSTWTWYKFNQLSTWKWLDISELLDFYISWDFSIFDIGLIAARAVGAFLHI